MKIIEILLLLRWININHIPSYLLGTNFYEEKKTKNIKKYEDSKYKKESASKMNNV